MESPLLKLEVGQDREDDRISALPDHLLLDILERLDLEEALRAGVASTRWRHLPHRLSRVHLHVGYFPGATPVEILEAFTGAVQRLLAGCDCMSNRAIKTLILSFWVPPEWSGSGPHLSSIGRVIEDVVNHGETECLEFRIFWPFDLRLRDEWGQQFMSFSRACPLAFGWLTMVTLNDLAFGDSDVTDLISACDRLERLDLIDCKLAEHSALKIDVPRSELRELEFFYFGCTRIELISVPRLRQVRCQYWLFENPPVRLGNVPELRDVSLFSEAMAWKEPFTLSECLSRSATNLSTLSLDFGCQMIWIKPEHPKHLAAMFSNLTDVLLSNIFPDCDLSWTLFCLSLKLHLPCRISVYLKIGIHLAKFSWRVSRRPTWCGNHQRI